jgi:iron-sulfur cluster repair protein YtfE (RIC family)
MTDVMPRTGAAVAFLSCKEGTMPNQIQTAANQPDTASLILELHHRRIDEMLDGVEIAVELGSWSEARALFTRLRGELEEHIRIEEQLMFPSFEAFMRTPGGPTAVMRAEHAEIARCLDAVEGSLDAEQADGDAVDQLEALLASHNAKEERVLYPLFERHAPPEAHGALLAEIRPLVVG